jgi:L-alanine-DL-glutamate epimerase-like enolase superfamily enzyme
MKYNRRDFSKSLIASALWLGGSSFMSVEKQQIYQTKFEGLSKLIIDPIIIKAVELLKTQGETFLIVTAVNGEKGITQCNPHLQHLVSLLKGLVLPHFIGKDARNLAALVENCYNLNANYKYTGMPLWNCIGTLEIACWDLIGKIVQKPVYQLLGPQIRTEYGVYITENTYDAEPDKVLNSILEKLSLTGAKGLKIKVGNRNGNTSKSINQARRLIPILRKKLGDTITINANANCAYSVKEALELGDFMEDYGVNVFEQPINFEDEAGIRNITNSLKTIKIASGEQVTSLYSFKRLAHTDVFDILQPDLYYNGGILCTLQVADIAKFYGKGVAPHTPNADPLIAPFWQIAAIAPNLYGLQETVFEPNIPAPTWYTPEIKIVDGNMQIPTTAGLGIVYDDTIFTNAEVIALN